ncbi:MAG: hypothetical protein ACRD2L_03860 [Terriglobia bacterium]
MKICNSSKRKTKDLRALAEFIAARCQQGFMADLVFSQTKDGARSEGHAWKDRKEAPEHREGIAPSLVEVTVPDANTSYPAYVARVLDHPAIEVSSWQEEVVLVMAHEFRHIDQFWTVPFTDRTASEHDAENFALKTLRDFQTAVSVAA